MSHKLRIPETQDNCDLSEVTMKKVELEVSCL
jgi:hypothetical protein